MRSAAAASGTTTRGCNGWYGELLGISNEEAELRVGLLIDALESGAPAQRCAGISRE